VVWTLDWLPAAMERTFCRAGTPGAALLPALDFREAEDVLFKKDSDDSFCEVGGLPEERTSCATLGGVLASLGHGPAHSSLTFVGQRFERCMLKSAMHARHLVRAPPPPPRSFGRLLSSIRGTCTVVHSEFVLYKPSRIL
jgi:nicotinamidase-related amidase